MAFQFVTSTAVTSATVVALALARRSWVIASRQVGGRGIGWQRRGGDDEAAGSDVSGWTSNQIVDGPVLDRLASGSHSPSVSVFFSEQDEVVLNVADRLRDQLDRGEAGYLQRTIHAPHWTIWAGGEVVVSLNATPARQHAQFVVRAMLQLAIERNDTPAEGLPPDPDRVRRIALSGTPLQRWYLAAERDLPDDVIAMLRDDNDPDVSAAMNAIRPATPSR